MVRTPRGIEGSPLPPLGHFSIMARSGGASGRLATLPLKIPQLALVLLLTCSPPWTAQPAILQDLRSKSPPLSQLLGTTEADVEMAM